MNREFKFTVYKQFGPCVINNVEWYVIPVFKWEYEIIMNGFILNKDAFIIQTWDNAGYDLAISSPFYNWLVLKYGIPAMDETNIVKYMDWGEKDVYRIITSVLQ